MALLMRIGVKQTVRTPSTRSESATSCGAHRGCTLIRIHLHSVNGQPSIPCVSVVSLSSWVQEAVAG